MDDQTNDIVSSKNPHRTIQLKIGKLAAKNLTPNEAAEYLKSVTAAAAAGTTATRHVKMTLTNRSSVTASKMATIGDVATATGKLRKDMPCSEKEMKALMSMFVESKLIGWCVCACVFVMKC
jgi:hypothetical protein